MEFLEKYWSIELYHELYVWAKDKILHFKWLKHFLKTGEIIIWVYINTQILYK